MDEPSPTDADIFTSEQPPLPILSDRPTTHPGSCLALSLPLLAHFEKLLPETPALVLSIGSGAGLLEALLLARNLRITGVEVSPSPNRYLPPANHETVLGSRSLHWLADDARVWLFVYPRRVGLVEDYIRIYGYNEARTVIWIGPTSDWEDYRGLFDHRWHVEDMSAADVGGRAWERIAVARSVSHM
ncbi:hypothetical protein EJ04DRAFT_512683 [Polyplosphaeria fusca]|uniref:Uncharacterized protein n=1 Tax=Polyplosphaeria fusca TaxID=682080 RepID=A0A9P4QZ92_9PLEO|nr:hypothetical protein EJ04DRAFT_512683 [Polyplosphaeria fusca]